MNEQPPTTILPGLYFICYRDRNIDGVTEKAMPPRKLTVEQVIATSRLLKWWIRKRKSRSRWKRSTRKIQTINSITSPVPLSHDLRSRLVLESILDTTHNLEYQIISKKFL